MEIYSRVNTSGSDVKLQTSSQLHFNGDGQISNDKDEKKVPFAQFLLDSIGQVQSLKNNADDLKMKLITNPEDVSVDEVMIASSKAGLSESFLKSISEKVMRAYNEISMLR